ncbi:MAG: glycerophosphodiester phosphodiesterase [Thermoleophilia bacterium]|nr:glycerophosphodiester phosphodiesterase [Thermoleophilia bacterium]
MRAEREDATGKLRADAWQRLVVLLGLGGLIALLLPAAASAGPTDWTKLRALNIAHQGGEDEAPSNTMYAFDRAMKLGSDMLELDIHTTKDNKIVVIHDSTVDRTTSGTGRVYDMTMAELRQLDAGYWMVPGEGIDKQRPDSDYPYRGVRTGERKPPPAFKPRDFRLTALPEVMKKYGDVPINIEIKGASDEDVASYMHNAEVLAAFLNKLGRTRGVMVASFNDAALAHFHQLAPKIDLAPATGGVAGYILADTPPPEGSKAFQVPTTFSGITVVDQAFVDKAHGDGYGVHVWTINDEETMNQLFDYGVDGIMTAEPMRLEKVMCERGEKRPKLPATSPGKHCARNVSIACEVEADSLELTGRRKAKVTLVRNDNFDSRCAGKVTLKGIGSKAKRKAKFNFGWKPPEAGGPKELVATVKLSKKLKRSLARKRAVRVLTHPYSAFVYRGELIGDG